MSHVQDQAFKSALPLHVVGNRGDGNLPSLTIKAIKHLATEISSIIALMLGRLRMSTECIAAYIMSEKLEEAIKTTVRQKIGDQDALLQDSMGGKT